MSLQDDVNACFKRLPGSSRHYIDLTTGNELTRAQRDKRAGELERQFDAEKALPQVPAHEFRRVDKSHYVHEPTGNVVGRTQRDKMVGTASAKKPSTKREKELTPYRGSLKPDAWFKERKAAKTHAWFHTGSFPLAEAPETTRYTIRYRLRITCDIVDGSGKIIKRNQYGYSRISYKWTYDYNKVSHPERFDNNMLDQAINSALQAVHGCSCGRVANIRDETILQMRFVADTAKNRKRYTRFYAGGA